jgi:hypothetical protein
MWTCILGTFALEHRFGEGLSLRNRTQYGDYDKAYQNVYPNSAVTNGELRLAAYRDTTRRRNLFSQTDLVWENRLGGVDQTLLLGFELGRQRSRNRRINGFFQPSDSASLSVPVGSPTIDANIIFRPVNTNAARTPSAFNRSEADIAAIYIQDQIRPSDTIEIVAGLRFDRFDLDVTNLNNNLVFSRTDELVSPRLGLILKPMPSLSFYASYSRSYLPSSGDQFASLDLVAEALKPEKFDNYEVGAKWEPIPGLLATLAVYQLDRTNTRAPDPADPARIVLTGAQRSRGIEIGLGTQHQRPLADLRRICAAESGDHAQDFGRGGRQGSALGAPPPILALEPLRSQSGFRLGAGDHRRFEILRLAQQQRDVARLRTLRRRALLQADQGARSAAQRRESTRCRLLPHRPQRQQYRAGHPGTFRGTLRFSF